MRFHYGEIIAGEGFKPAEAGWTLLRRSGSMWRTLLMALPVGVAGVALATVAWFEFAPPKMPYLLVRLSEILIAGVVRILHAAPWMSVGQFSVFAGWGLTALVGVVLLILAALPLALYFLVHEFVHVLAGPSFGLTDRSVIGFWPAGGVAYAHYDGEMSRERWLVILLMPFLVLSVLPFAVAVVSGRSSPFLAALSLLNVLGSYVDLYNAGYLFFKVPAGALVISADNGMWFKR